MLTAMRGATGGIVAKTFLVLLAGSFAVWGVADVFTGSSDQVLAKIGKREISAVEFRNFFDQRLQLLSRSSGQALTVAQARKIGLDRQILGDLLRGSALDEQAQGMKMLVSDAFIAKQIAENPAYQDASGNFSASALQARLYQSNVTEQQFIINERSNLIRSAITATISDELSAPKALVRMVTEQASEQRDVAYFTINSTDINIPTPTDKQAAEFYIKNKARFSIPERRVFELMTISSAELGKTTPISEEILKETYEREKARFGTPEMRIIEQIPFGNTQEAKTALKRIREGIAFDVVANERGLTDKDRLLGTFNREDVPDVQIGNVAFKLAQGVVSEPISGKLSTFLVRVTKITPENIKTFSQVRDDLVKIIQIEAGRDEILNLRDKVEDERGGGTPFKEIAKNLGLTYKITPALSRQGLDEDGKPGSQATDWAKVLQAGNQSDIGLEIDPIATVDDGFIWVNVQEVIQAHAQAFNEAKDKAAELWKADQLRQAIQKKAEALQTRAKGGDKFAALAKEVNSEIKKELGITRRTASENFDGGAVRAAFAVGIDQVTISVDPDGKSAKVMSISPVLAPPYNPASTEVKELEKQLNLLVNNDVFAGYMSELQKTVGVEIMQNAWQRVFQSRAPGQ